jgi:hypothetical protein
MEMQVPLAAKGPLKTSATEARSGDPIPQPKNGKGPDARKAPKLDASQRKEMMSALQTNQLPHSRKLDLWEILGKGDSAKTNQAQAAALAQAAQEAEQRRKAQSGGAMFRGGLVIESGPKT